MPPPSQNTLWPRQLLSWCAILAVLCFYGWTVTSNDPGAQPLFGEGVQGDYYKLQLDGFLKGHLYIDMQPDPRLLKAKNPYDPKQRDGAGLPHDTSFYRGHIYINYGVTPVLALRLPWRLVTRHDLPENYAVLVFTSAGFLAAAALWLGLRRRYFPESSAGMLLAGVGVLGLASMTHAVLRRPSLWEEPIAAGYCFAMLMLLCLYRAGLGRRATLWLAAAGLCLGLAVGSRPNYVAGVLAFLVPLAASWWRGRQAGAWRLWPDAGWWLRALALGGSFGVVLAGLAWYNFARFGNPFEFGTSYQFTNPYGATGKLFGLRLVRFNVLVYYLAPAEWSRYFPFAKMIRPPAMPAGYSGIEYVYGLLTNLPFSCLALLAPLAWWRRAPEPAAVLRGFIGTVAVFYLSVGGLLLCFVAAAGRYMVDFAPSLMLLACLGLLGAERLATGWGRAAVRGLGGALAAFSIFVGLMLNFQLHDLLRQMNPASYQRLAHFFDQPVAAWERWRGAPYGPLELTLRFPRAPAGTLQALVTTGWEYESDYLIVYYIDDHHLKFGFVHTNYGVQWSEPIAVDYDAVHHLRVQMGSLFPPLGHPLFDGKSHVATADIARSLRVTLDGELVFDVRAYFYDSSPGNLYVGGDPRRPTFPGFGGVISAVRRVPYVAPPEDGGGQGRPMEVRLEIPEGVLNRSLPLVVTGETGKGDLLGIRLVRPGVAHFFYDHWGYGLRESGDVTVSGGPVHLLRLSLPALLLGSKPDRLQSELSVDLDGRRVWTLPVPFYPADLRDLYIGENGIGASSSEQEFPGMIRRIEPGAAAERQP